MMNSHYTFDEVIIISSEIKYSQIDLSYSVQYRGKTFEPFSRVRIPIVEGCILS